MGLPFVPPVEGVAFIDTENEHVKDMLSATGIAQWPSTIDLIERYLIPAMTSDTCGLLPDAVKVMTAELIFRNYFSLSKQGQAGIHKLPIVPVEENIRSNQKSRFCSATELFHPTAREIDGLFFPDELVYPRMSLFDEFGGVMLQCGLRWKLTWPLALERIRLYARTERPLEEVATRVKVLFRLQLDRDIKYGPHDLEEVNNLPWIPVRHRDDRPDLARTNSQCCRSSSDRLIAGRVLPILEYGVHSTWQRALGWYTTFPVDTLVRQLQAGVADGDLDIVNAVLAYITQRGLQMDYVDALRPISCILGSCGTLFPPTKVFIHGATRLSPYLGNIHKGFQRRHHRLLGTLGLSTRPSLQDLFHVQKLLVAVENPLSNVDLAVAIEVVYLASTYDREKLAELKIPDQASRLQSIENIAFWDLEFSSTREKAPLVHPNIPEEVTERLGIQPFSEKILMGKMGIHDQEDEDEFHQYEKTTTRIADTLGRYPISTTFNEYLANAEDSGTATRVDWVLDECLKGGYPTERLLSKDLAAFQGEALFVHNDGMFLDEDFEGLRNVGRGSKREETWTIGQFGRGAQTMYHWTDVPMLVSGKYFLVLDPQQRYLPLNRRYGRRKPGLKVELANIRDICCDQLAPFHGLWGYSQDMDEYEGTIFRFPLRPQAAKTTLTENRVNLSVSAVREHLENYFQTARLSLIFLQRVKQVSFRLRHMKEPHFRVEYSQRLFPLLCTQPYRYIHISYLYRDDMRRRAEGTDEWWIAKSDIREVPSGLQKWQKNVKRRVKDSKCGIALLCSPPKDAVLEPQMFSFLPLPFASHLPVHINASFVLSGDRQSILVGGSSPHEGSAWNQWLLQGPIPRLYLDFLDQIVRRLSTQAYKYWPTGELSKDGPSDLIRTGFWEEVAKSQNRLYPKAARMLPPSLPEVDGQGGEQRDTPGLPVHFDLKEAVFDFISATSSYALQDIFREWFPGLVRVPGDRLPIDFRGLGSAMTELTPSMVRKKLLDSDVRSELRNYADGNSEVLNDLLQIILPERGAEVLEIAELNNCPILPLQDGSLGTLRYLKSSRSPQIYFCVTAEECNLFSFASNLFVRGEIIGNNVGERSFQSDGVGQEFIPWVFNSSMFNVRELTVQDLGQLLQQRASSEWESTSALESWLEAFWFYFRIRMPIDTLGGTQKDITARCGIEKFPVFQATKGGKTVHISPASFESLPAVVEPSLRFGGLLELCLRFPDLYVVNRRMTPFSLEEHEPETEFFVRFLNAIAEIASAKSTAWEAVVSSALNDSSRKVCQDTPLRRLMVGQLVNFPHVDSP
jgi:sacsin